MMQYGPGATGVGWEWSFMEMARHLAAPKGLRFDECQFAAALKGKGFIAGSSAVWAQAAIADGDDRDAALAAAKRTRAFFCGET
jgi:hypothetical protein